MEKGLLLSFDGTDCSGKATQAAALAARLKQIGWQVTSLATPDYNTDSGRRLRRLFQMTDGSWDDLSWEEQMRLLADNRAEHRSEVIETLINNGVVVYDRYVPSSLAHMVVDALPPENVNTGRQEIIKKVREYEYGHNQMPQEDISIFLDIPPALSSKLLTERQAIKGESHETTDNLNLQTRIYNEYLWHVNNDPSHYLHIGCVTNGMLLSAEEVSNSVWEKLVERLPQLAKF